MQYQEIVEQSNFGEWREAHKTGIGASQIAAVLGESRFGSRLRVWAEKVGRLEPRDLSDNEAVQMGIELEPFVAEKYFQRTKRVLSKAGMLLRSDAYPWAICTPDYWIMDDDGTWNIPCQIKTTSAYRLNEWADGPPVEVWWQVQHEMFVTGAPWASVGVLVGGQRFMWADVQKDSVAHARIANEGNDFWHNVKTNTYPEPDSNAADVLNDLFPTSAEGEEVALPQDATEWDRALQIRKAERAIIDDEIDYLENKLKLAIGPAGMGVLHNGSGAFTHKTQKRVTYKLADGQPKPTQSGVEVRAIANISDFRVLRRSK